MSQTESRPVLLYPPLSYFMWFWLMLGLQQRLKLKVNQLVKEQSGDQPKKISAAWQNAFVRLQTSELARTLHLHSYWLQY